MNNEIKEILDRLERIDHKEYSCGFEFADSGSFDEDCRCFEERKKMANYITNLQQENKKLNGAIQTYDILLKANTEENKQLKDNWNNLKKIAKMHSGIKKKCYNGGLWFEIDSLLDKMQELEGSDSNE